MTLLEEPGDVEGLPPFPKDISTAPLLRLKLQKLLDNDPTETERLWQACTNEGFFYLDLRHPKGELMSESPHVNGSVLNENGHQNLSKYTSSTLSDEIEIDGEAFLRSADRLFPVGEELFALPVDEKARYDLKDEGSYFGYKGYGSGITDQQGTRDRNEFYNVSKDDILGLSDRVPAPKVFEPHRPVLRDFIKAAHATVSLLLAHLSAKLELEQGNTSQGLLESLHRLSERSGDQVRFTRAPPQPVDDRKAALGAHSDFGSVTLLFNKLSGLQVLPQPNLKLPSGEPWTDWAYVRPLPGQCIVNLGDSLVKFTAGILKSATHRVINPPGAQGSLVRQSLVYFARAEDPVLLNALKGRGSRLIDEAARATEERGEPADEISAKDWTLRRALGRRGVGTWINGTEVTTNGNSK